MSLNLPKNPKDGSIRPGNKTQREIMKTEKMEKDSPFFEIVNLKASPSRKKKSSFVSASVTGLSNSCCFERIWMVKTVGNTRNTLKQVEIERKTVEKIKFISFRSVQKIMDVPTRIRNISLKRRRKLGIRSSGEWRLGPREKGMKWRPHSFDFCAYFFHLLCICHCFIRNVLLLLWPFALPSLFSIHRKM